VQPSVRARRRRRRQRLILLAGAAAVIFGGIGIGVILPVVSAPLPLAAPLLPGPVAPATIASLPPVDPPPALTSAAIPAPPVSLARAGSDTTPRADAVVGEVVHRRVAPAEGARSAADNSLPALNGPPSTLSEAAMSSQAKPPLSGESTRTTSSPSMVPQMRAALLRRGKAMFALGDISSARLFFRRAAEGGSAIATTALGKTYDPGILTGIGVRGLRGDRATAAGWYQRAITLGDREAEELLAKLVP
jgi:TPR repeat protein